MFYKTAVEGKINSLMPPVPTLLSYSEKQLFLPEDAAPRLDIYCTFGLFIFSICTI